MDGFIRRRQDDVRLIVTQSHMTATLSRVDKIPKLESLLSTKSTAANGQVPAAQGLAAWGKAIAERS